MAVHLLFELPELLDLLLPTTCAGCRTGRTQLCPACRTVLSATRAGLAGPQPAPPGLPPLHAAGPYADPVRRLLIAHKERGALRLAGPLGQALARAVRPLLDGRPVLLVPMPSTRRSVRARGHDPTLRLARAAARELRRGGHPVRAAPVLRHCRAVADQSGLTAAQRRTNLHGALTPRPGAARLLTGRHPVLVDDLVTTGATLAEAARALTALGHPPLGAATVAAAVRRTRPGNQPG
ncbi:MULTISPECIES: ComF family protein [unclassified Kitasatospora]|uniref:ComF family protein n=1 Tax=unclassified Kitasatospora TaxID=2633591 RepID=UPI0007093C0C|nr:MULTISPECIES: phosphoribosyltransferase family protein [unclassified Kitasatospora]KQV12590.1 phosphoribosyltransferase [Kitasatospora sp. Root107]KRB67738.1 phosphoribosyltransferase [Kitasatospora sp. Root187]